MFNKFKVGQIVWISGYGKNDGVYYKKRIAKVVEKDDFFCDYLVRFKDGTCDWLDEKYLKAVKKYNKKEC